jgi:hypothetical protein
MKNYFVVMMQKHIQASMVWGGKVENLIEDIRGCHFFCVDLQSSVEGSGTLC